jgi:cyclase
VRLISRLDVKGHNLIKGVQLEGLRVVGAPGDYARRYYKNGVDEILIMDCVASLYGRNNAFDLVKKITEYVFVPITLGGGIRTLDDVNQAFDSGADKICLNTAAIINPDLIAKIAATAGSQAVVLSVEAKKTGLDTWEVYYNNGREKSGWNVRDWVETAVELGAGEVLLTSVDREGTRKGMDIDLIRSVGKNLTRPLIVSGGVGSFEHVVEAAQISFVDAVAIADFLHYGRGSISQIKSLLSEKMPNVRVNE